MWLKKAIARARARRRARRMLAPYLERTAWSCPATEAQWLTPAIAGFMAGAITRITAPEVLDTDDLAALQLHLWADLIGGAPDLFATRLHLASTSGDPDIRDGHARGIRFAALLLAGDEDAARDAWDKGVIQILRAAP